MKWLSIDQFKIFDYNTRCRIFYDQDTRTVQTFKDSIGVGNRKYVQYLFYKEWVEDSVRERQSHPRNEDMAKQLFSISSFYSTNLLTPL